MNVNGEVQVQRRRSRAEADRLVEEFEQSGLGRKEFCAVRGLSMHTLDAWRKRLAQSRTQEKIVSVEIVEDSKEKLSSMRIGNVARGIRFGIVLAGGLRIEVEPGFDAGELRRLIAALDDTQRHAGLSYSV